MKTKKFTNLDVLLKPSIWFRLYRTDSGTDKIINQLIDIAEKNMSIINMSSCTIEINDFSIWIANKYYSFGSIYFIKYQGYADKEQLCTRKTALRLENLITNYYEYLITHKG